MRDILFRGKKYKTSAFDETDWAYGSLIDSGNHEQVAIYPWVNGASTMSVKQLVYARMEAVDPETVGQYTGMTDSNGKKIFEGDIVVLNKDVKEIFDVDDGEIRYGWGGFYVKEFSSLNSLNVLSYYDGSGLRGEVIGNIHDNPELLRMAKN